MGTEETAVFVAVCGRVERVEVPPELTLEAFSHAVAARFDLGGRLRFVLDEEGEPEVLNDEQLVQLIRNRQAVRVVIGDQALADLEARMWQLRKLQWGFFQDELDRTKSHAQAQRNEQRQLRQALESSAKREVELTGELMKERMLREQSERNLQERHEALFGELRAEQRAREVSEAQIRQEVEDSRQASVRVSAQLDRQVTELKSAVVDESRARGRNIEALLSEWAGGQSETRQSFDAARMDLERTSHDAEQVAQGLLREASARQAFEQFFSEKLGILESSIENIYDSFGQRVSELVADAISSSSAVHQPKEAERFAGDHELQRCVLDEFHARAFTVHGSSTARSMAMASSRDTFDSSVVYSALPVEASVEESCSAKMETSVSSKSLPGIVLGGMESHPVLRAFDRSIIEHQSESTVARPLELNVRQQSQQLPGASEHQVRGTVARPLELSKLQHQQLQTHQHQQSVRLFSPQGSLISGGSVVVVGGGGGAREVVGRMPRASDRLSPERSACIQGGHTSPPKGLGIAVGTSPPVWRGGSGGATTNTSLPFQPPGAFSPPAMLPAA